MASNVRVLVVGVGNIYASEALFRAGILPQRPARSLAPAIWAGELGDVWIYIIGPLLGAAAAGLFATYLARETDG